jgi:hypothetical protein
VPVQIAVKFGLTSESYVCRQGWKKASIQRCPKCKNGMRRHGTYERKHPAGTRIARQYCHPCRLTLSLLPEFLAAGFGDSLGEFHAAITTWQEQPYFDDAAAMLRPDIEQQGARRWLRRRVLRCAVILTLAATALGCAAEDLNVFMLRESHPQLIAHLPTPIGLSHRQAGRKDAATTVQHSVGPDPPQQAALPLCQTHFQPS